MSRGGGDKDMRRSLGEYEEVMAKGNQGYEEEEEEEMGSERRY